MASSSGSWLLGQLAVLCVREAVPTSAGARAIDVAPQPVRGCALDAGHEAPPSLTGPSRLKGRGLYMEMPLRVMEGWL